MNDLGPAIRSLLASRNLQHLWADGGPTAKAQELLAKPDGLSRSEHVLLQVAFDMWNGTGGTAFRDVLVALDYSEHRQLAERIAGWHFRSA